MTDPKSKITVVVQYKIQNDETETHKASSVFQAQMAKNQPNPPNIYILPQKYGSVREVSIADVIKAFPLQTVSVAQGIYNPDVYGKKEGVPPMKPDWKLYSHLHFRFETCVYLPNSQKKMVVFKDVVCNEGNLAQLERIPAPLYKDYIKLKVLKLPTYSIGGVQAVKKQLPQINKVQMTQMYRNEIGAKIQFSNTKGHHEIKQSGGITSSLYGAMEGISSLAGTVMGGQQQKPSPMEKSQSTPKPQGEDSQLPNKEQINKMASEGMQKLGQAAENLKGVFGNIGSTFMGSGSQQKEREVNLNFSDDGDDDHAGYQNFDAPPKEHSLGFSKMNVETPQNPPSPKMTGNFGGQFTPTKLSSEPPSNDFPVPPSWKTDHKADPVPQSTNLLFGDEEEKAGHIPESPNPPPQQQEDHLGGLLNDGFGDGFGEFGGGGQQPASDYKPPGGDDGFNIFNDAPQASGQDQQFNHDRLMTGLQDLNFDMPAENPVQQNQSAAPQKSRTEEVGDFFAGEQKKRDQWDDSKNRLQAGIDKWIGVQAAPPMGMNAMMAPKKNHIKVLLGTLHLVLWQGNTWKVVGMDKLGEPSKVKLYYRKAITLCHPDKINANNDDPDKVYIANQCFAALTEAYNEYKNEPGINL